ncbi:hypothetical protein FRC18_004042 [Serendipita sp. 400]|nr:hypothetical protein FRC18_004042 [Serendipita sp. 400]
MNTAAVLHGAGHLTVEQRPRTTPPPGYAEVKIMSTTLCGSDLHYYAHGRNGTFALRHPLVLGHEAAGVITAVTPSANGTPSPLRVGQRVAIECGIPCCLSQSSSSSSDCKFCKSGRYNLCPRLRFCSSAKTHPHLDGTLQNYLVHPIQLLHPLPTGMSYELGALAEPLGVVIHAARRAGLMASPSPSSTSVGANAKGARVLVFGAGAVGLLACMLARALGATQVVCVDVNEGRLQFAKQAGFVDQIFNPLASTSPSSSSSSSSSSQSSAASSSSSSPSPSWADQLAAKMGSAKVTAERIMHAAGMDNDEVGEEGFDVVFECSGAEPCIQAGIYAARLGGKVLLVGMGTPNVSLPLSAAACREVDLIGVFRYATTYPAALALLSSGVLEGVEKMITHTFDLDQTKEAFDVMKRGVDQDGRLVVKVCVRGE